MEEGNIPFRSVVISRRAGGQAGVKDVQDAAFKKLAVTDGSWLRVRPDGYFSARLEHPLPMNLNLARNEVLCLAPHVDRDNKE